MRYQHEQVVETDRETIWNFFAQPANLARLTPDHLRFTFVETPPAYMQPGSELRYSMAPLLGLSLPGATRIETVEKPDFFTDIQLKGPFSHWHHRHEFVAVYVSHTLVRDVVDFGLPGGRLAELLMGQFVTKEIEKLFAYRRETLKQVLKNDVAEL